jgi:hypothetical protein
MDDLFPALAPIKSALFVDFDNIYIGLSKTDPAAAERFASDPARWLAWLEKGLPVRANGAQPRPRSILVRRCYPNPDAGFRRFRSFFTSAAFSVTDCPTLTRTGKNSSDIYMVMDILDILNHKTYFDEFIIFSGDSDFMPVLLRLRAHDRRTTTLAIDFMPPAYKASCDLVINEEEFIEDALGISHEGNYLSTSRARVPVELLKDMVGRVYACAQERGEVDGADLPDILKDFKEFRESTNWLGFGTSQRLADALVSCETRLHVVRVNPLQYKIMVKPDGHLAGFLTAIPSRSYEKPREAPLHELSLSPFGDRDPAPADGPNSAGDRSLERPDRKLARGPARAGEKANKAELSRLRGQVITIVREMVSNSPVPILLARASQHVVSLIGPRVLETQWAGAGSFKRLLQGESDLGLEITTQPEPGYIFDPQRHENPAQLGHESEPGGVEESPVAGAEAEMGQEVLESQEIAPELYEQDEVVEPYDEAEDEDDADEENGEEEYAESLPSIEEFSRRVSQVTGAPALTRQEYALVFRGIVNELREIAEGQKVYNTYQSSKAVSDWCTEQGMPVSRSDVVLVFKGVIFQDGGRFGKRPGSYTAQELATVVCNNIRALCRRSQMELSDYENRLLDEWIVGGLENGDSEAPAPENGEPQAGEKPSLE